MIKQDFFHNLNCFLLHGIIGISISVLCLNQSYGQNIVVNPYLQDLGQDKVIIMWEADNPGTGKILYGVSPFSLTTESISITGLGSGTSQIHAAILSNLTANTKYYYKVSMADGTTSKMYTFKTLELSESEQNTQFIAMSDMQRDGSKPDKFREIVEEGIVPIIYSEIGDSLYDLEAILIPGDLVVTGGNYTQWQNHFFSKADSLTPNVPLYPVAGNHEYSGGGLPNFKKYFSLPQNGAILEECWYKDISNVRIIGLNSNSGTADQNTQLAWLGEVLDSACTNEYIDFVFAELHHPFKSELWTPGENGFTGKVIDSLETFTEACSKASIHFFGHTHGYSRGQSRDHKHLWMNVATAGGAIDNWGEFPNADYPEFVKSQDEYGFVLIDVEAGDDPMFTIKRYGRGDQDVIEDNVLRDELTIMNNDIAPQTPINIYPVGDSILPNCIKLKASTFYGEEDIHQASHWQISESQLFENIMLAEKWAQNENFYNEVNTQANDDLTDEVFDILDSADTIYWRVRYRNQNLEWSEWSSPTSFFIGGSIDTISTNLVLNEGAENDVQNWTGDIESLEQAECGSVSPHDGNFNFGVGGICQNESSIGLAFQSIDLVAFQTQIDNDSLTIGFGAFMRNFNGSDVPEMYVELYDKDFLVATSSVISNATANWIEKTGILKVPSGVDSCRVVLKGTRNAGTDNDSYFDLIHLYLVDVGECVECFGASGVDSDEDGFCDDLDCNDNDVNIYPGAVELCNNLDDDCDGKTDSGNVVTWTGMGGNSLWNDPLNWDQPMPPLPCQHVIIDNNGNVIVNGDYECLSVEVKSSSHLEIDIDATLIINSQNENNQPSCNIEGSMTINGRCELKNSQGIGIEVHGILTNNNKLNISDINLETIKLYDGSRFDNLGKTVLED